MWKPQAVILHTNKHTLFFFLQVMSRWEEYMSKVKPKACREVSVQDVAAHFPFHKYFSNAPQPVFKGQSYQEDMDIAEGCYRHIRKIFTQLEVSVFWSFAPSSVWVQVLSQKLDTTQIRLFERFIT